MVGKICTARKEPILEREQEFSEVIGLVNLERSPEAKNLRLMYSNGLYLTLVYWLHSILKLGLVYSTILKNAGPSHDRVICEPHDANIIIFILNYNPFAHMPGTIESIA
jgi:hypothetical protein